MPDDTLWTDKDLAKFCRMSPGTIRNRRSLARRMGVAPNLPPALRIGSRVRWRPADVVAWLERQREGEQLSAF